ncbi:hypothetical protein C0993_002096 [Termitomyces sp. T159_Od127]|nr:hypothetical protein C0993_002096 [Termitomyces sp. T159_Od127]
MLPTTVSAPATQFEVVMVATDPRTPAQYNGLMAETSATSKGKTKAVPTEEDTSDYGQSSKEDEEEEEEGEMPTQRFQHVQQNKKLAKKANRAEAAAALACRAQNNFSERIPDGLGVKIWGPLNIERLNSFFHGALGPSFYYLYQTNTVLVGTDANCTAAYKFSSGNVADMPQTMVYKVACRGFPCTPYELERLFKYCANPHVPCHDRIVAFMLISELRLVAQRLDTALQDRTMQILLQDALYQDLPNPIQGPEDMAIIEQRHISMCFLCTKDDEAFDLEQIVQYALIYSQPGLENTWQGIAVDFAYCMHWQTLFGFALRRALCMNSAGKTTIVQRFALVMAHPGLYREAVAAYAAANPTQPFVAQFGANLEIRQVHIPDDQVWNFTNNDAIRVLIHNRIPPDWVDHAYMYGMVYLEQQFHQPTMSLDVFQDVNDERLQRLVVYGMPPAIPNWDGWREISEEDHYCLLFKRADKMATQQDPELLASITILEWTQMWITCGREHRRTVQCQ